MSSFDLNVNGKPQRVESWDPEQPLLYALRNDLRLHGAKFGRGGQAHHHHRRPGLARAAAPGAGRLHRRAGLAVRLLHQRHGDVHGRAAARHAALAVGFSFTGFSGARRNEVPFVPERVRAAMQGIA